ncbi:E3 ubiquitin-protein ligase RNF8-like isoform X2 [Myzus persicae]|uniref:E3 ubiquitin-protein ligase RNF8-like isoform X2 n=1 Tax=Myzus persicae TaxID=13164 RepID=UPI000B931212|nr:E3 ubiquitin-protein ligase RNF8-like isoform X2 [Myzus persicae]
MLEDIKNIMNSKRINNDSKASCAFVQDTKTGELYDVKTDSEFLFGRLLKSSIVIEQLYISRSHSTIRYENDQYLLKDNNSCTGTYLNYKKIKEEVPLTNGDLIAYTDKCKTWDFVYKFCLISNPKKKCRLEEENSAAMSNGKFKTVVEQLQNQVNELKNDKANILNDVNAQRDEFKKLIDYATETNIKINKEMIKLREHNETLKKEVDTCQTAVKTLENMTSDKVAKDQKPAEELTSKINKLLENDFQCAICNEVIIRPSLANCNHIFCESCLRTWLSRSIYCPTCRSQVVTTTYCLPLDNYITNLCDLLGGTIREQRVALQTERNGHPPQVAKRGRRKGGANQSNRSRREVPPYELIDSDPTRNNPRFSNGLHGVIEIVDLTNSTR